MDKKKVVPAGKKKPSGKSEIKDLFAKKGQIIIDLGCGENKTAGSIGVDFRKVRGVDVVQDLSIYPWDKLPNECADVVIASHLLEHINPDSPDPRLAGLLDLLLEKGVVTKREVEAKIGDYRYLGGFVRFMDEVWRIMKPDGRFLSVFPYAGSPGYWQDPTHVNPISHVTLAYFDPLAKNEAKQFYGLYSIYRPKPWKIEPLFYNKHGFIEVALVKRRLDPSYGHIAGHGLEDKKQNKK